MAPTQYAESSDCQPVALVTGAAGGIGQAICSALAEHGFRVFAADLRHAPTSTSGSSASTANPCTPVNLDVTQPDSWPHTLREIEQTVGRLDLLVNNAGILTLGSVEQTSFDEWQRLMSVNLTGAFLGMRASASMLKAARGSVVNISSVVALRGNDRMVAYAASKAGLLGLTYASAKDFARDGVRVNAVCPGTVDTPMSTEFFGAGAQEAAARKASIAKHPLGRLGLACEVAAAVVYLSSAQAAFVTGIALPVDGGRLLG
jgi:NAD(P)-dependent dehydrogenase (short-subunit alcohol dehydrogenase family)